ncbi:CobW/HypB/UreG, nucleotide-binding domain-containing protein [Multifurca ochricompacta]|uniref:CobW/HypB/UreG, nucleotide-binding domain-containing protein n=1 Tax=Multifurca ochricompacta TaxID=376703 RepID=A0AAD4QLU8_9AGAM|nr:CobW/HypB/UreG, nucleotide-binding domain-containing protein [Multifurca ochricompacta]
MAACASSIVTPKLRLPYHVFPKNRCCVLVGQMKTALLEILEKFHPDRIIIESSGSAFPATLAFQIRELERETERALSLDAIVTVIDAENFTGYEDTSVTARMQAQYTDVLLINKWEHVPERALDEVLDHLNTLNELTPKIRCAGKSVDPALIFGIDSKLFRDTQEHPCSSSNRASMGKAPLRSIMTSVAQHAHMPIPTASLSPLDEPMLTAALGQLPKESVYRVKGFIRFSTSPARTKEDRRQWWILNWAFGRWELVPATSPPPSPASSPANDHDHEVVRLTVMGERGEVRRYAKKLAEALGAAVAV